MRCDICGESNVEAEHEISERHLKNKVLSDYSTHRKQFSGNRKGVIVQCNVMSSFSKLENYKEGRIQISAKPNEEIKFKFTIKNDCNKEEIVVIFIQRVHNKMNFSISNHGLEFGSNPVTLKPKETLKRDVTVSFKSPHIGQYQAPLIFSFRKPATNEGILIVRDMVVFVEEKLRAHEKIDSPYTMKEVKAEKLYKSNLRDQGDDMFRIPNQHYKRVFASALRVNENAPEEQRILAEDVRDVFATGVTRENYVRFFHNLLWYEETIARINLKKYNMSSVLLLPRGADYQLVVPGLAEKRPSLMIGDLIFVRPHDNELVMFEAVITAMSAENVVSIGGLDPNFRKYFTYTARFDVRFFMSRLPLERMHQAVHRVGLLPAHLQRVFPEPNARAVQPRAIDKYFNPQVEQNPEQRRAVEHIAAGSAGAAPYLLHGPPGTGKTVTIVEAVLQLVYQNPKNRILVCTDSNMAADHVASVLIQYAHMFNEDHFLLRASSQFRVWECLPECLHKYSNGTCRDNFEPITIEDFQAFSIVVTTLSHAAKFTKQLSLRRMQRSVTHLFIDEAAQASEPACLIPATGLLAGGGALVLAGDPRQLGPVVISHSARRLGLGKSLMERLQTCALYGGEQPDPRYSLMLRNNFRSDPAILQLPNEIFYRGQLRALASPDPLSATCVLGQRAHSRAVVFHGVLSKEQRMGKSPSYYNTMELEILQMYVTCLIKKHAVKPEDIGIVTPYIRQVYKVKEWLDKQTFGSHIEVGTVEAFQGKEKRVVLISTVRASCDLLAHDAKFQLGFLVDDKRFNVALTRAKAKAIIIGNPLCLEKDVKWRDYIQKCRDFDTHFGYDTQQMDLGETRKDILRTITPMINDLKIEKTKA